MTMICPAIDKLSLSSDDRFKHPSGLRMGNFKKRLSRDEQIDNMRIKFNLFHGNGKRKKKKKKRGKK